MEERALYRAILGAPHDDAVRLAYADWLDENADALPQPAAERGRAEFIRLQCEQTRLVPNGWQTPGRGPVPTPAERRLLFRHGKKWRRAFKIPIPSAPFDRGFLRPLWALPARHFLNLAAAGGLSPLPDNSPARRYAPEGEGWFAACPLWDIHLYAPGWLNDPNADQGQYGPLLDEVAQSPALRQVGWLKLSFLRTPVIEFLRTGRFDNVETLVLNSGPFPDVLRAVADNESFRSLRYIAFGTDLWAWAPSYPERVRFYTLQSQFAVLNDKHLPFGAMRDAVRSVLENTPLTLPPMPPAVNPSPLPAPPTFAATASAGDGGSGRFATWLIAVVAVGAVRILTSGPGTHSAPTIPYRAPSAFDFKPIDLKPLEYKIPDHLLFPTGDPLKQNKYESVDEMLKKWREMNPNAPLGGRPWPPRAPVATPPRAVERAVAPPPRAAEPTAPDEN